MAHILDNTINKDLYWRRAIFRGDCFLGFKEKPPGGRWKKEDEVLLITCEGNNYRIEQRSHGKLKYWSSTSQNRDWMRGELYRLLLLVSQEKLLLGDYLLMKREQKELQHYRMERVE